MILQTITPDNGGQLWRSWLPVHPAADLLPMMSDAELQELADDIKENGLRDPIKVFFDQSTNEKYLLDGRNRAAALALLGQSILDGHERLNFDYVDEVSNFGRDFDPYAYVLSLNVRRRHLTIEQKHGVIATLLKVTPARSNRVVAKVISVDHKTVARVRAELEGTGEIPQLTETTGADGKSRPAKRPKVAKLVETPAPDEPLYIPPAPSMELMPVGEADAEPEQHIFDRQFGPLSGGEWLWLGDDCRRATGRGRNRRRFYSDVFMKLVAFHGVPIKDLEEQS